MFELEAVDEMPGSDILINQFVTCPIHKSKMSEKLENIDGSLLEGGGQILRLAITLSALCGIPVRLSKIRGGRSKPGLMAQHLKGLKLLGEIAGARIKGDEIGSTEIEFWPTCISGGYYSADTQTAGSIGLLLQVALPCTFFANSETTLKLKGGTNAAMAPQFDYTTEVFRANLEKFNATFHFDLLKRGYFPRGGGEVHIYTTPVEKLNAITLIEQGDIKSIYGWSYVAGILPIVVAHKMADSANKVFEENYPYPSIKVNIERYKEQPNVARDNCSGLILVAETTTGCIIGSSALGEKNKTPEEIGMIAAQDLVNQLKEGVCVDNYSQDQIIIFMALADGVSQVRIGKLTQHTKTAIYVVEQLLKIKFDITQDGTTSILKCKGIGLINNKYNK